MISPACRKPKRKTQAGPRRFPVDALGTITPAVRVGVGLMERNSFFSEAAAAVRWRRHCRMTKKIKHTAIAAMQEPHVVAALNSWPARLTAPERNPNVRFHRQKCG